MTHLSFLINFISILRKRIGTVQPIIYIGRYLLKQIKMKTHLIIVWITAFGMIACNSRPQTDAEEEAIKEDTIAILDFASAINKEVPDTFTWNSVAKKVIYIPLSSSHLMDGHPAINYLGDDMCILSEGKEQWIHRVDFKGSFLSSFRHVGNGPGEYVYLSSVVYHPKDSTIRVFDNGSHKYIIYSKEGKLFREINLVDSELNYLLHAEGDTYFCSGSFSNGKSEIIVSDTALRVKSSILPFDPTDDYVTRGGIMLTTSVQRCGPKLCLFNHIYSDSVFLLTPDGLKPEFILRKGKYAPSLDDVKQFMKWNKNDSFAKGFSIKTFPGYYLVQYSYKDKFFGEIWSKETNQIVSRTVLTRPDMFSSYRGIPYRFPSGTTIKLLPAYINGNKIAFFIPADEAAGEIPGVKISEDDNPIVMILEL